MFTHHSPRIDDARAFATWAHAGQVRKYTGEPYVRHVEAVAAAAPLAIQNIKLCDLIDNTSTIMQHDPEFGERYMGEKYQLLMVMAGSQSLWEKAHRMIRDQTFYENHEWRAKYAA